MLEYGENLSFQQASTATWSLHAYTPHTSHTIVQLCHKAHQHMVVAMENKFMKAHGKKLIESCIARFKSQCML